MQRGVLIVWKPARNAGIVRDLGNGVRYFFELPPERGALAAQLRVGDLVAFRATTLPRAEDVALVGRFVPVGEDTPAERISELL